MFRKLSTLCVLGLFAPTVAAQSPPPDFETQVIPVLTRAGCNAGACHGAAIGRGGFKLSLLGYDPDADYESLIYEFEGRRVHLAEPEKSLVLRKPSQQLPHEGGTPLPKGSAGYQIVLDWIKAGAPRQSRRTLTALEIQPKQQWLVKPDTSFPLKVFAEYDNGKKEDVTRWAVIQPTDKSAVRVSRRGTVTALRRGQHTVMVRFLGMVDAVTVTTPVRDDPPLASKRPTKNFIDEHIYRTLDALRLPISPAADDATFLRRVYLDLIGTLPTRKEVLAFLNDERRDKRQRLVETLLQRPEFVDHWTYKWGDWLRIESKGLRPEGAKTFHTWIRKQIANNTPLDKMARAMLMTTGDGYENGPVNFHRVSGNAGEQAEYVSQVFLGVRLQCANCHNHPFDRWTQDDYHGLAAVFANLQRGRVVTAKKNGEAIHPNTGEAAIPRIPGEKYLKSQFAARAKFTDWLLSPDNPYFAKAAVNRIWRELMGRGLVEPVDDHRATNPPTHPELLQALARDFAKNGYEMKHTIRTIVASAAYQRSSLSVAGNKTDDRFYSKMLVRRLPPQVMVDAVVQVTGVSEKLPGGVRAIELGDSRVPSRPLDLLGRCSRDEACESTDSGGLALTLHRLHGLWLNAKITNPKGVLHRMLKSDKTDREIVESFYVRALSRTPTKRESAFWEKRLGSLQGTERVRGFEDFLWALLNASEFGVNH